MNTDNHKRKVQATIARESLLFNVSRLNQYLNNADEFKLDIGAMCKYSFPNMESPVNLNMKFTFDDDLINDLFTIQIGRHLHEVDRLNKIIDECA